MSIFKEIRDALVDIEYHSETPATKEEIAFAGSMKRFNERHRRIHDAAPDNRCPRCNEFVAVSNGWVVKKDLVVCRSCYFVADAYFWDGAGYRIMMKEKGITHRMVECKSGLSYSLVSKLPHKKRISTWVLYILLEVYRHYEIDPAEVQAFVGEIAYG